MPITSNDHSIAVLEDDELRAFHDLEFSLDYPTRAEQDARCGNGNWELIYRQVERCVKLGVPITVIAVMVKSNSFQRQNRRASTIEALLPLCERLAGFGEDHA